LADIDTTPTLDDFVSCRQGESRNGNKISASYSGEIWAGQRRQTSFDRGDFYLG
jgi:hypothetical protein